ncbi:MAG: tetratricopeptide repeat protein [Giesbergeria sp.]
MPSLSRLRAAQFLALSLTAGAVLAQNAAPNAPSLAAPVAVAAEQSAALDAELFYEIFLGEISVRSGDPGAGYSLLMEAARRSQDENLYQRATDIALQSHSGEAALAAARAWGTAWPASHTAQRYLLQILLALNRTADTAAPLTQLLSTASPTERQALVPSLPALYSRSSDKPLAAATVSEALKPYYTDPALAPAALVASGRMQLAAGDRAGALASAQQVASLAPDSDDLAVIALDLLEAKAPGADALVQKAFASKRSPQLRMAYARVLLELQRYSLAQIQVETVTQEHPELVQPWMALAALQLQNGEVDAAEGSLTQYTKAAESQTNAAEQQDATAQIYLLRSEIAEKRGRLEEAESWLARIEDGASRFDVQVRRASLLARQGKLSHARALIQSLPDGSPEEARRKLTAEVQLLRDNGKFADAYALQSELVKQAPDDADLLYDQAMLAEKAGDLDTMERLLRKLIAGKPDFHHAYNALGYSFAERGIHLGEARKLVETALRLAPGDPFIIDSLAWVEFRSGNQARALELLAGAFAARKDPDIGAHYGEVLWASGDREHARAVWREAVRGNATNPTLLETLKRLGVAL